MRGLTALLVILFASFAACQASDAPHFGAPPPGGTTDAYAFHDAKDYEDAHVYMDAKIYEDAHVYGDAKIWNDAHIYMDAPIPRTCLNTNMFIGGGSEHDTLQVVCQSAGDAGSANAILFTPATGSGSGSGSDAGSGMGSDTMEFPFTLECVSNGVAVNQSPFVFPATRLYTATKIIAHTFVITCD